MKKIAIGGFIKALDAYKLGVSDRFFVSHAVWTDSFDHLLVHGPLNSYESPSSEFTLDFHNIIVPGNVKSRENVMGHMDALSRYRGLVWVGFYEFTVDSVSYDDEYGEREVRISGDLVSVVGFDDVVGAIDTLGGFGGQ